MAVPPKVQSFELLLQQQAGLLSDLEKQLKELRLTHKKMEKCLGECPATKRKQPVAETPEPAAGTEVPVSVAAPEVKKPAARRVAAPRPKKAVPVPEPVAADAPAVVPVPPATA